MHLQYNSESDSNDDTDGTDDESLDYRSKRRKLDKERVKFEERDDTNIWLNQYTIGNTQNIKT